MNIKSQLITLVVVLTWTTHACAEGTSLKMMSHDDVYSLVKQYEKEGLKEYKNFDDFYLVMENHNFPNLSFNETASKMKGLNFENPQSISIYRSFLEEQNNINRKKAPEPWKPLTESDYKNIDSKNKNVLRESQKFIKDGYYSFYKDLFQNRETNIARICFNVDVIELGLVGMDAALIPQKERKKIISKKIDELLSKLELGKPEDLELSVFDPRVSCDALITVTEPVLDKLYGEVSVMSILPPIRSLPIFFQTS